MRHDYYYYKNEKISCGELNLKILLVCYYYYYYYFNCLNKNLEFLL